MVAAAPDPRRSAIRLAHDLAGDGWTADSKALASASGVLLSRHHDSCCTCSCLHERSKAANLDSYPQPSRLCLGRVLRFDHRR